jgi:hypothetical protein
MPVLPAELQTLQNMRTVKLWTLFAAEIAKALSLETPVKCAAAGWL